MATVTVLGPASLAFPVVGAALAGDTLYVSSRNLVPSRLAAYDLVAATASIVATVPTGDGAWGLVVVDDEFLYLGQFGAQGEANVYRYTIASGSLDAVAAVDADHVWGHAAGPDGSVYGVSAPPLVWAYDPASGLTRELDVLQDGDYARSVAVAGERLLIGGDRQGQALLLATALDGSQPQSLLPEELADHQIVYALATDGQRVVAGTRGPAGGPAGIVLLDAASGSVNGVVTLPDAEVVDAVLLDGSSVIASTRPEGTVVRAYPGSGDVTALGTPVQGAETRGLFLHDGGIVGASATELAWRHDGDGFELLDLVKAGVKPGPERAQSIAVGAGAGAAVAVGGNFGVQLRDLDGSGSRRDFVPGEPKAMMFVGERLWLAMYPTGELWFLDPGGEAQRAARFPPEQNRPISITHDPDSGLLLIGTAADRTGGGALCLYDPERDHLDVVTNPHEVGHVGGIAVADGIAYLGGSGADPSVLAFDLASRRVLWQVEVPGARTLIGADTLGPHLHVLSGSGYHGVIDLPSHKLVHGAALPGAGGQLVTVGLRLYAVGLDALYWINPANDEATLVLDELDAKVWGWPPLAADTDGLLYLIRGTDLIRVDPS